MVPVSFDGFDWLAGKIAFTGPALLDPFRALISILAENNHP
jgi:hypothetical protein